MKNSTNKIVMSVFVAMLLMVFATSTKAQNAEFGFRFMPTFSSFEMKTSEGGTVNGQVTLGYGFGVFLGYNFTEHAGIQGEIIYSSITQKYKDKDIERKINLRYLNIPLLLSLNTGKTKPVNLNLVLGPQLGIRVGSSVFSSGGDGTNTTSAVLSVKKGDVGFAYGAGVDFGLNSSNTMRFGVGFRGVYGLFDVSDNSTSATTNSYYILDRTHIKTYSAYFGLSFLF